MKMSDQLEKEASSQVAALMAAAARTAPKTRGLDNIEIMVIDDDSTKARVISTMKGISKSENRPSLERDANSIAASQHLIVIGVKANPAGLNCGFCGYANCGELSKTKGICAYNSMDLGIAVSSAAEMAGRFHIDNRLMYSIGRACLDMKLFSGTVKQALGIPLSVTGKNPFFDRK
ncbi:MAG: ferredoxin [Candidatus Omnitrophica bacterium]|nr:ferredoxin [Candidatus Omnitrophota bacterium]